MSSLGQEKGRAFLGERGRQGRTRGKAQLAGPSLNRRRNRGLEQARFSHLLVAGGRQVAYSRSLNNFISYKVSCYNIFEMPWDLALIHTNQHMAKLVSLYIILPWFQGLIEDVK